MRSHPYLLNVLKYATITLGGMTAVIAVAAVMNTSDTGVLSGRLVSIQEREGVVPTENYDAKRATEGFSAEADTHVIFTIPQGVRIPRITFFGGTDIDQTVRYWGYCFSGNEAKNKQLGKTGTAVYDGHFFYSFAERQAQTKTVKPNDKDLVGILDASKTPKKEAEDSIAEIFTSGQTCYLMSSVILPAGIDADGDGLNNMREVALGTDPNNPDTDRDGIGDGVEVFTVKTDPRRIDSDDDGQADGCEEKNANGTLDAGETSPLVADTDRDGLCDGNGIAGGCPEEKATKCWQEGGDRICRALPSSPVYGEDMNGNCKFDKADKNETDPRNPETYGITDWTYKWNLFQQTQ